MPKQSTNNIVEQSEESSFYENYNHQNIQMASIYYTNMQVTISFNHQRKSIQDQDQYQHVSESEENGNNQINQQPESQNDRNSDSECSHVSYQHSSDYQSSNSRIQDQSLSFYQHSNSSFNQYYQNFNRRRQTRRRRRRRYREEDAQQYFQIQMEKKGLQKEQINSIPILKWSLENSKRDITEKCSICLFKYKIDESLRVLSCLHRFHQGCLDIWLKDNSTCPTCRGSASIKT